MKLIVTVTYRDDKKEIFDCVDFPSFGDYLTLYLTGFKKVSLSKEAIARIEQKFV